MASKDSICFLFSDHSAASLEVTGTSNPSWAIFHTPEFNVPVSVDTRNGGVKGTFVRDVGTLTVDLANHSAELSFAVMSIQMSAYAPDEFPTGAMIEAQDAVSGAWFGNGPPLSGSFLLSKLGGLLLMGWEGESSLWPGKVENRAFSFPKVHRIFDGGNYAEGNFSQDFTGATGSYCSDNIAGAICRSFAIVKTASRP